MLLLGIGVEVAVAVLVGCEGFDFVGGTAEGLAVLGQEVVEELGTGGLCFGRITACGFA